MKSMTRWSRLFCISVLSCWVVGWGVSGWADTVVLNDGFSFLCEMHIEDASRTFDHDPAQWLEFEYGTWTLAIPRSMVASATEDDLYERPEKGTEREIVEAIIQRIREREEPGTGGEQIAALGARVTYLRNFAESSSAGQRQALPVEEGDVLPEGSKLEVKRNSRAEVEIGERTRVGIRAGTVVQLKEMKHLVQGAQTRWKVGLGLPVGGIWVEVAGLGPGEEVEMNLAGCQFSVASDCLLSVTSALGTEYVFGFWRGPQELRVKATEQAELWGFSVRPGYMVVFGGRDSSATERRLKAGREKEWEQWREFKPVTFSLQPRLVVPPLKSMPSKGVLYSLRKTRVTESVAIRGEITSNLLEDLEAYREALPSFHAAVGRYPTADEGLDALREDPGAEGWNGPYVGAEVQALDPWDQPYRYRLLGSGGEVTPVVYSTGQNRIDEYGLGDDIQ
jgi:hypothetical protein